VLDSEEAKDNVMTQPTDPTRTTLERLQEIRARAEKATAGPWEVDPSDCGARWSIGSSEHDIALASQLIGDSREGQPLRTANAAFIAHAREDIPWLLAKHERLATEHAHLRALLKPNGRTVLAEVSDLFTEHERLKGENADHERTVKSIAVMLGWMNVPPRSSLEANVAALKSRAEAAESRLRTLERGIREWKEAWHEQDFVHDGYRRYRRTADRLRALVPTDGEKV
jgi:hypothetical protein